MHITILEASDLPNDAFLSVRVGETKRLRPFKVGESFSFSKSGEVAGGGFMQLDAFEKIGSLMARSPGHQGSGTAAKEVLQDVVIPTAHGESIAAKLKVALAEAPANEKREKIQARHKLALDAKNYLDCNDIWGPIQGMLHALLKHRPQDPVDYMISFLNEAKRTRHGSVPAAKQEQSARREAPSGPVPAPPPATNKKELDVGSPPAPLPAKERVKRGLLAGLENGSLQKLAADIQEGAAEEEHEVTGFPVDVCPVQMPDLSNHNSVMAEVLRNNSSIYKLLKDRKTTSGVSFARCIKPGMDDPEDAIGAVAGDEECYDVFRQLFDPVLDLWHGSRGAEARHMTDLTVAKVSAQPIDPTGKYAVSVRVRGGRNLRGLRMLPASSHQERREVERLLAKAFAGMQDEELLGEYLPLEGSSTFPSKLGGMTHEEAADLDRHHLLFRKPSAQHGLHARGWPHARGVFATRHRNLAAWCNEQDHLRVISLDMGADLAAAFGRFVRAMENIERAIGAEGREFARSERLGFLSSCPSDLGSGLRVSVMLQLPLLLQRQALERVSTSLGVLIGSSSAGLCEVTNSSRLGVSEVDSVNAVIDACAKLVALEQRLEEEEAAGPVRNGADNCPGKFPRDECPQEMPDLSQHHSMMAHVFKSDPSLYGRLRSRRTRLGVGLALCIKSGVDNPGHPMLTTVGAVAGDEECYDVFRELFDSMIQLRHGNQAMSGQYSPNLSVESIVDLPIDPLGKYAISARVRGARNLAGLRLPPACDRAERIEVERALTKALSALQDEDLRGKYCPLKGSCSYPSRPGGMSDQEEEELRSWPTIARELQDANFLFEEPDSLVMLCSGMGRDWPEARGVYVTNSQKMVTWLNEEDHMRLVSLQAGGGLKEAFERFVRALAGIEGSLAADGYRFARSDRLGYITSCPSNLGTGLRANVLLRLPLLSKHPSFQDSCRQLGLQASAGLQSTTGEILEPGVCDVASRDRFCASEVDVVNNIIQGCIKLVSMEQALERGEAP